MNGARAVRLLGLTAGKQVLHLRAISAGALSDGYLGEAIAGECCGQP